MNVHLFCCFSLLKFFKLFFNFVLYVINFQFYVFQATEELLWELLVQAGPVGRLFFFFFVSNHYRIIVIESV